MRWVAGGASFGSEDQSVRRVATGYAGAIVRTDRDAHPQREHAERDAAQREHQRDENVLNAPR